MSGRTIDMETPQNSDASSQNRTSGSLDAVVRRAALTWNRIDVEQVILEAEAESRRYKKPIYVGAIAFPEGSQIYGDGTLGFTDDKEMITGLGTLFATCEPHQTTRHA